MSGPLLKKSKRPPKSSRTSGRWTTFFYSWRESLKPLLPLLILVGTLVELANLASGRNGGSGWQWFIEGAIFVPGIIAIVGAAFVSIPTQKRRAEHYKSTLKSSNPAVD